MNLLPPLYQTSKGTPRDINGLLSMLSQSFGEHPEIYGPKFGLKGHNGLDWPCSLGTPIYASHDGIVSNQTDSESGKGVVLTAKECKTLYWHLERFVVDNGVSVKAGTIIGFSGNTGFSTGSHLHFGFKMMYNGQVLNRNNGYDGAVDPTKNLVWSPQPSNDLMTKEEVKQLQALEGYSDEAGIVYWTGKPLSEYLKIRLADKIRTITEAQ